MKTKHPSTARLICILQLSHTIFSRAAQDPSGEITVRFSPPKSTQTDPHGNLRFVFNENDQVKCKAENGQTHMHAKLQEHVQKEIGKMLASGQMPEKFKLDLPPEMHGALGNSELTIHKSQLLPSDGTARKEKTFGVPASSQDEPILRVEVDRSELRRINQHEYEKYRKNKKIPSEKETGKMDNKHEGRDKSNIEKEKPDQVSSKKVSSQINHEDILKKMMSNSYSKVMSCSSMLYDELRGSVPISLCRYPCFYLLEELGHHQKTGMWSEKTVLEEAFFLLLGLNEKQILNVTNWQTHPLVEFDTWLKEPDHCSWGGVTCGITTFGVGPGNQENTFDEAQSDSVDECLNSSLKVRQRNRCDGSRKLDWWTCQPCPPSNKVTKLDLTMLDFTGVLSENLYMLTQLRRLNVMGNSIVGGIPDTYQQFEHIEFIDVSKNGMEGPLPDHLPVSLIELWLEENRFTGNIPQCFANMKSLHYLDVSSNKLQGSIPSFIGNMTLLNSLYLSRNQFTGQIPEFQPTVYLRVLDLSHNALESTLPVSVAQSIYALETLDLSSNRLTGTLPVFLHNTEQLKLNLTANRFIGAVPSALCHGQYASKFGCDVVMCKAGKYSPSGAATYTGPCVDCPDKQPFLGQTTCSSANYSRGSLSEREVLHLLYIYTNGDGWDVKYQGEMWSDLESPACELPGITCHENKVTKINLTDTTLCTGHEINPKSCLGLPSEIGLLSELQSLDIHMAGGKGRLGTIPNEFSSLKKLEYLNLEGYTVIGSIDHLANIESLQTLILCNCDIAGTLPPFGSSNKLQLLNLASNEFTGTIPQSFGHISDLEELMLSRNRLSGTIIDFSALQKLDNLEVYGNLLTGPIPLSLTKCSGLKRVDLFSNMLTGTIPSEFGSLQSLQILHFKSNKLSGRLPPSLLDHLPDFMWLDASDNRLTGTVPASFAHSKSLKDLRLGGNEIYGIAEQVCSNIELNGAPKEEIRSRCDHILCPLGTTSDTGFATSSMPCEPCPEGQSTLYLGSSTCQEFSEKDILRMMFEMLSSNGDQQQWSNEYKNDWTSDNDPCQWHGITCEDGEIVGLAIPGLIL
ncbi:hypothetical protein ACHAXN_006999 [Cyclotella atomus]